MLQSCYLLNVIYRGLDPYTAWAQPAPSGKRGLTTISEFYITLLYTVFTQRLIFLFINLKCSCTGDWWLYFSKDLAFHRTNIKAKFGKKNFFWGGWAQLFGGIEVSNVMDNSAVKCYRFYFLFFINKSDHKDAHETKNTFAHTHEHTLAHKLTEI